MEYAKLIVLFLFLDIHLIHCQTSTSNLTDNCSFSFNTYSSNSAVANQFTILNRTSIVLTAYYALISPSTTISAYDLGLIYSFATTNYFVPFPLLLNCTSMMIQSCLLQRVAGSSTLMARDGEPINVRLSSINYTFALNQQGFYLGEGQYQLSNCSLNNGQIIADNQTKFSIQIRYEKSQGTSCNPTSDTCGSLNLTNCSPTTSTCTCLSTNPSISYMNFSLCADTLNVSGCGIFPQRCINWCNSTSNELCICPSDTLRIHRNNLYVCELSVNAMNCSPNDSIRRCPFGQICLNQQCKNEVISTTNAIITTTTTTSQSNESNSTDERLRIALGVIAGLLGTSLIILLGVFFWLRYRQKRARLNAEKSLSPSSSMTSSLYISPIQQQEYQQKRSSRPPPPPISHFSNNQRFSPIYRTNSFRQAILSGQQHINPYFIERVSTKPDHLSLSQEDFNSRSYNTSEYPIPNQNIYQTIITPSTPSILTHCL